MRPCCTFTPASRCKISPALTPEVLTQRFDPDIRKELMQPLAAHIAATGALRFRQFENVSLAVR